MSACDKCGWSKQGRCRCGDGTSVWSRDQAANREGARAGEGSNITKPKSVWDGYSVWGERNGTPKDVEARRAKMGLTAGRGSDMGGTGPGSPGGHDFKPYGSMLLGYAEPDPKSADQQRSKQWQWYCRIHDKEVNEKVCRDCFPEADEPVVVSVRQEAWVNGEKVFVSSPKPAAPQWAVGQKVRTPAGEDGVIVFIRGPNAWIECGTAQHLWPLSELTRPAPKRRTVTVHEWRRQGRKQTRWFSGGPDANQKEWEPTGRTYTFEMEET